MKSSITTYRLINSDRKEEFFRKGYKKKYFFPHKYYFIPKCGVDGFRLANDVLRINNPNKLFQVVLYAYGSSIHEFPSEIFFDKKLIWHQQHFGKKGQIATANLIVHDQNLYTMEHQSDIVQRIYLRKEFRTRINSYFKYWHHMLLNSILVFAVENNLQNIISPTADLIVNKYVNRKVDRKLFDRIYDNDFETHFEVEKKKNWWIISVAKNISKVVIPEKHEETLKKDKITICISHDVEKGLSHLKDDKVYAKYADDCAAENLQKILSIENKMNLKTTYNVVGLYLEEVRHQIEQAGHCIAFHSYNHETSQNPIAIYKANTTISKLIYKIYRKILSKMNVFRRLLSLPPFFDQMLACRDVDYRLKGYRPIATASTTEINDIDLCFYNFEWLGIYDNKSNDTPFLENRIIKIPIFCDDFDMYKHNLPYEKWEKKVINKIKQANFVAINLHDCYAQYWISQYDNFLKKILHLGEVKTFNDVANEVFLSNAY